MDQQPASERQDIVNPAFTSGGGASRHSELGGVLSLHIDIRIGDSALMNRQKSIPSRNEKYGRT